MYPQQNLIAIFVVLYDRWMSAVLVEVKAHYTKVLLNS